MMTKNKMDISIPYYDDLSRISNSNIGWFLNRGPAYLHNMLTGKEEGDIGPQLDKGTMIHKFVLQSLEFWHDYILYSGQMPSSTQQNKFCEELINSVEIEPNKALLSAYKASYSVTGRKGPEMLLKAKEIASTLESYIETLRISKTLHKKIITDHDAYLIRCVNCSIMQHKLANYLLKCNDKEYHNEFHINWEHNTIYGPIKCKSLLDHIEFDKDNKICIIADLKTTVHVQNFELSIKQYDYFRQLEYYKEAALWYIEHELGEDPKEWTIRCYIVAVDSIKGDSCRVFKVSDLQLKECESKIQNALNEIKWHQINNKWDQRREYYEGDGSEKLVIE